MHPFLAKTLLIISAFLNINNSLSKEIELPEVTIPQLPKTGATIQDFVPSGWAIESSKSGDLGGDSSQKDHFLLLKMQDEHNILYDDANCHDPLDTNPRLLVFLLARNGHYFLAGQNSTLIPRQDIFCDTSDPIDGVTGGGIAIHGKKGVVELGFFSSGSSGHKSFHFQWLERSQGVYLTACNYYSRHRTSRATSNVEADYIKQQVHYEETEFDQNDDEKEIVMRDEVLPLSARPLIPLEDIDAYYHFDCSIMKKYRYR